MDHLLADEVLVGHRLGIRVHEDTTIVCLQPLFPVRGPLLVEDHVDGVLAFLARATERYHLLLREVLLELRGCASTQTLVILHFPPAGIRGRFPMLIFTIVVEGQLLLSLSSLQDWSVHEANEAWDGKQGRPLRVEQVHTKRFDMCPIQILISQEQDAAVP